MLHNSVSVQQLTDQRPASRSERNLAVMYGATSRPGGSAPRAPSLLRGGPRWRILLWQLRQCLAHGLRPDLGADGFQGLDARRQEIAVAINEGVQLPEQGRTPCGIGETASAVTRLGLRLSRQRRRLHSAPAAEAPAAQGGGTMAKFLVQAALSKEGIREVLKEQACVKR